MFKKYFIVIALLAIAAMMSAACAPSAPPAEPEKVSPAEDVVLDDEGIALSGQLQIAGSTTIQPLAEVLGEAFMDMYEEVSIDIQGGGSSVGVTAAGEGTADIGMSSREIKESEIETFHELQVITIAFDGIAIVINPGVEISTLTKTEARAIFNGSITNFSEVGGPDIPITVVSREEGSGTRAAFEELFMRYKNDAGEKVTDLIVDSALLQQSNGQVRTVIAETPNTIGYLSFGFLDNSISGVPIDSIEPTVENVKNGTYSIFRPLNMETGGEPSELAQAFLDYILSADGQAIIAEDYITVD